MPDYPDYTKPITITGVTIETLPIDIKAQTVTKLDVDIVAQSVGNITVNIGTGAVSVSDINTVKDGDFEAGGLGWTLDFGAEVATDWPRFGLKCLRFPGVSSQEYATSPILAPAVPTDNVDSITLWMKVAEVTDKLGISIDYTDGTWTDTVLTNVAPGYEARSVDFVAGKFINMIEIWWEDRVTGMPVWIDSISIVLKAAVRMDIVSSVQIDMNIAASAVTLNVAIQSSAVTLDINIVSSAVTLNIKTAVDEHVDTDIVSSVTLNVDIVAQTVGNISIDIAAQTVGNIAVNIAASAVTLNVNLQSQTVDINIKTSGGVNLVIDKLTQTAYLEDRRTLSNNGATPTWIAEVENNRRGKFFPRGCRGFINTIDVYCKDAGVAGGTITVYISPHPSIGPVAQTYISVPTAGPPTWRPATFNRMWNYDSMFIFVVCSGVDIQFAHDAGTPLDEYRSLDLAATWVSTNFRSWFRVVMKAMTVGDLPVSGTLNVIEIPNLGGARQNVLITVPAASIEYDTVQPGSGRLLVAYFIAWTDGARDNLRPRILCDGVSILPFAWTFTEWSYGVSITSNGILLSGWDTTNHRYVICVLIPYPFKRSLQLGFGNISPDTQHQGYIGYCWVKTS